MVKLTHTPTARKTRVALAFASGDMTLATAGAGTLNERGSLRAISRPRATTAMAWAKMAAPS